MTSVGMFDPDWVDSNPKRPAWATPKSELAKETLAACGRKYFRGQNKHNSEYESWESIERKVIGASDECYLQRMWIKNVIEWTKKQNISKIVITFGVMLHMMKDESRISEFMARNKERLLIERKKNIPNIGTRTSTTDAFLKELQIEESDE